MRIEIEIIAEHLFADGSEYNESEVEIFYENLSAALELEYPDADIEISIIRGVEGGIGHRIWVDGDDRHDERWNIKEIIGETGAE